MSDKPHGIQWPPGRDKPAGEGGDKEGGDGERIAED